MKPRHGLLALALAGAAGLLLWGDPGPSGGLAEPVPRAAPRAARPAPSASPTKSPSPTLSALHPRSGDSAPPAAQEASLFARTDWTPPAVARPAPAPPAPAEPADPVAPPLPYSYLGKAFADGQWQVFLARGQQTYIATLHSVLDNSYRVEAIAPPLLTLTYLPLNQAQQLPIGTLP